MGNDKSLKSAYELAMERLRKSDEEGGVTQAPLTDAQKAAVADVKTFYQAKLAELEILHQGRIRSMRDPDARAVLQEEYRRDRERLSSERDAKLEAARRT